jgi:hypothetical protein
MKIEAGFGITTSKETWAALWWVLSEPHASVSYGEPTLSNQ